MKTILSAVVGATLALAAVRGAAETDPGQRQVALVIESETLADALNQWAEQTGLQLISPDWKLAEKQIAPRVKGTFRAQEALEQLLEGSPLTYVWVSDKAVAIRARPKLESTLIEAEADRTGQNRLLLAQARELLPESPSPALPQSEATAAQGTPRTESTVDEIVVTGSRLRRHTEEGPAPVTVFDRQRLDQLGVTTIAEVLNYLPQQSFSDEPFNIGASRQVRLRGLSAGTTLVLINGRRTVTSATTASLNYFDLNTIPLSAVERIEVLSASASAVYGSDAIGGVVNIILKDSLEQPSIDLHYGASKGGAAERRASLTGGYSLGRFRSLVALDATERRLLLGAERDRSANQDFTRFGSIDRRSATANPGNVSSLTAANLPGLSSRFAAVPAGSSGIGLTPSDFAATSGQRNLESLGQFATLVPESERASALATMSFDLTEDATLFAELLYADREDLRLSAPLGLPVTVPAANPFNPFGVPVSVNYLFEGIGSQREVTESESFRAVGGIRGNWGSWDWELAALKTRDDGVGTNSNSINFPAVLASLASTDPDQALNVFQDGPGGSASLLASLRSTPSVTDFSSQAFQGSAFVRGPLFETRAGTVDAVLGAESRSEDILINAKVANVLVSQDRQSTSAYSEVRVPFVGPSMSSRFAEQLSVTIAGRYDHYSDFGDSVNPQYGIEWNPIKSLLIRGSYGTSFRAPSLFELHNPRRTVQGVATDPRRNNETVPVPFTLGGNVDLDPEEADTWSAGFVLDTGWLGGLRLAASYWQIEQEQRVQTPTAGFLVANEQLFPDRVVRAAPTPADIAAGLPGRLAAIDARTMNFGILETSGVDLEVAHSINAELGRFTSNIVATRVDKFRTADFVGAVPIDRVGVANTLGTIPRWRFSTTVDWSQASFGLAATARYVSSYDDVTALNVRSGRTVDSQTLVDVQGSINFGSLFGNNVSLLNNLVLRLGVQNVFDEEPEFAEVGTTCGCDTSQADRRQRFAYATLSKSFK